MGLHQTKKHGKGSNQQSDNLYRMGENICHGSSDRFMCSIHNEL
jgi:hypothetical protein